MNYRREELIDRLASEYVLGTLRGPARRRFDALMNAYVPARRAVMWWEQRLAPLAMQLPRVSPPLHVWTRIQERIAGMKTTDSAHARRATRRWQAIAASFAVMSIALGTLMTLREPEIRIQTQVRTVEPAQVAILLEDKAPLWLVNAFPALEELRVLALRSIEIAPDRSYELWMLPGGDAAPVSLGLLPLNGEATLPLTAQAAEILRATSTLAVSLEPEGGSPTGAPTGPVVYTAPIVRARG